MVLYICPRCQYNSEYKGNFRNHLNRKHSCPTLYSKESILEIKEKYNIIDKKLVQSKSKVSPKLVQISPFLVQNNQCSFCGKTFQHKQSKYKHEKENCKVKKEQSLIKYQETKIEELEKALIKAGTTNITNNNNTQNNTINININNFGKENLDYITYKDIKKHLTAGPYGAIRRLIQLVHYNKKHPENHNIAITNKKSKYGSIKKDNVWQLITIKDMLNNLIETKFEMITEAYYGDIKEEVDGFKQKKFEKFFDKFEYDEEQVRKYLDDKIHLMLMNCTKLFNIKPK